MTVTASPLWRWSWAVASLHHFCLYEGQPTSGPLHTSSGAVKVLTVVVSINQQSWPHVKIDVRSRYPNISQQSSLGLLHNYTKNSHRCRFHHGPHEPDKSQLQVRSSMGLLFAHVFWAYWIGSSGSLRISSHIAFETQKCMLSTLFAEVLGHCHIVLATNHRTLKVAQQVLSYTFALIQELHIQTLVWIHV